MLTSKKMLKYAVFSVKLNGMMQGIIFHIIRKISVCEGYTQGQMSRSTAKNNLRHYPVRSTGVWMQ